ncbi:hypothetical protein ACFVWL_08470 [Microbacterium sp. NPDC058269]|uniref:hypothetical protein n=1 Tax=Microbacterium sp. NPDC058269 TaxID=3346414 RepID=UPI0036DCEEFD
MNRGGKFLSGGFAALALAGALALSGCAQSAGSDVASLESGSKSTTPDGSGAGDKSDPLGADPVKFAGCMRENGIDMPDPDPNAPSFQIPSAEKATLDKAIKACQKFLGTSEGGDPTVQMGGQIEFSKCMRENGVPGFPDPDAEGQVMLPGDVDPESSEFQKAMDTCEDALQGAK